MVYTHDINIDLRYTYNKMEIKMMIKKNRKSDVINIYEKGNTRFVNFMKLKPIKKKRKNCKHEDMYAFPGFSFPGIQDFMLFVL